MTCIETTYANDGLMGFMVQNWDTQIQSIIRAFVPNKESRLRIGILGAHGVGKTTLAYSIHEVLGIPLIDEIARTVHNLGFPLNKQTDIQTQALIWMGQLYEELINKEFVADRTLIDPLCYGTFVCERTSSEKDSIFLNILANLTLELVGHYSTIFYLPIEFELENDGVRDTDPKWQLEVDQELVKYLTNFNINYVPLKGTPEQRLDRALEFINDSK